MARSTKRNASPSGGPEKRTIRDYKAERGRGGRCGNKEIIAGKARRRPCGQAPRRHLHQRGGSCPHRHRENSTQATSAGLYAPNHFFDVNVHDRLTAPRRHGVESDSSKYRLGRRRSRRRPGASIPRGGSGIVPHAVKHRSPVAKRRTRIVPAECRSQKGYLPDARRERTGSNRTRGSPDLCPRASLLGFFNAATI